MCWSEFHLSNSIYKIRRYVSGTHLFIQFDSITHIFAFNCWRWINWCMTPSHYCTSDCAQCISFGENSCGTVARIVDQHNSSYRLSVTVNNVKLDNLFTTDWFRLPSGSPRCTHTQLFLQPLESARPSIYFIHSIQKAEQKAGRARVFEMNDGLRHDFKFSEIIRFFILSFVFLLGDEYVLHSIDLSSARKSVCVFLLLCVHVFDCASCVSMYIGVRIYFSNTMTWLRVCVFFHWCARNN